MEMFRVGVYNRKERGAGAEEGGLHALHCARFVRECKLSLVHAMPFPNYTSLINIDAVSMNK